MLRILFAIFIGLHGLIHLMGFFKAYDLVTFSQLTQDISKFRGVLWLLAAVLILTGIGLFLGKQGWWWMPGLAGALLSQALIFLYWQDAGAGTLPNALLLLVAIAGFGNWQFERQVRRELAAFWPVRAETASVVEAKQLSSLPLPVQQWLQGAGVVGQPRQENIHLIQEGTMRTEPDGQWMNFRAQQWFTTAQPAFLWQADVGAGSWMRLSGKDQLLAGKGHMLIKAFSLIPIVNARGSAINQGTLLRYLAEIIWFPSAALAEYIHWEPVDDHHARATLTLEGQSVSGVFTFNEQGEVVAFEALRYYDRKEGATLETWHIKIAENSYRTFNGIRIPTHSEVSWKLATGEFTWLKLDIVDLTAHGGRPLR